jgi:CheY-like chemotaxis protein
VERFERFEIVRTLSQGGMADLFLARERTFVGVDRLVALKRLRLKHRGDPDLVATFLAECRLALRLEHPRIVRAYGVEEWEENACLVLEYLEGVDAGSLIAAGLCGSSLGLEAAITIGHAIADALDFAHGHGVVHRDISPSNLHVGVDGAVRLLDFGAAAVWDAERRTPKRVLKGKFAYLSPEQCRCEPIDGRSDLFSLGVVLYELITGHRPFRASRAAEVVRLIASQPVVPPRLLDPTLPPELDALLLRMLEKDRARRPACAAEVRDGLVAIARRVGCPLVGLVLNGVVAELSAGEVIPRRAPAAVSPPELPLVGRAPEGAVVLVVDDEESFHAVARKRLQSYRRISAYSALQALDALAAQPVDVVLLDLNLPDRNGLDILEDLRAAGGDAPVIVCTGDASVDLAVQCMKRGAFDFLVKTHESFAALGSRVQSALRRRSPPPVGVRTR